MSNITFEPTIYRITSKIYLNICSKKPELAKQHFNTHLMLRVRDRGCSEFCATKTRNFRLLHQRIISQLMYLNCCFKLSLKGLNGQILPTSNFSPKHFVPSFCILTFLYFPTIKYTDSFVK